METRAIIVAAIVALFWLAPKPSTTQARQIKRTEVNRVIQPDDPRISITPYVRPDAPTK